MSKKIVVKKKGKAKVIKPVPAVVIEVHDPNLLERLMAWFSK